jgi:hypothetical protein
MIAIVKTENRDSREYRAVGIDRVEELYLS